MPSYEGETGTKQNKGTDTELGLGTSLCPALQVLKLFFFFSPSWQGEFSLSSWAYGKNALESLKEVAQESTSV